MPVRNLTDRPQVPRLGKIRLGDNSGKNGAPVNLPYFVVPDEVKAVYGEQPTELRITFISDDLERIANQYYRAYNRSNGLICKGDGFNAQALLDVDALTKNGGAIDDVAVWAHHDAKNVVQRQISCAGEGFDGAPPCPMYASRRCGVRAFYQFMIDDVPGLGVYQLDTGSVAAIVSLNGAIKMAQLRLGTVAGVPMLLRRIQREFAPDGKKKKVWTVDAVPAPDHSWRDLRKLLDDQAGALALLPPVDETEIYAPLDDEGDEPTDTAAEPEQAPLTPSSERDELLKRAPVDLLSLIEERLGAERKVAAIQIMQRWFGTQVVTRLDSAMRDDYRELLVTQLTEPDHEHDLAYTASSFPVCRRCGLDMEEPS